MLTVFCTVVWFRSTVMKTVEDALVRGLPYAIYANASNMESKHQANKDMMTLQGYYGGRLGQGTSLVRILAGTDFLGTFLDSSDKTNLCIACCKAVKRHRKRAQKKQKELGRPVPFATPPFDDERDDDEKVRDLGRYENTHHAAHFKVVPYGK